MRRRAEEEEEERKKKAETEEAEEEEDFLCTQEKRKSSQLLPSFVVASQDANKENVDVTRNVPCVKKSENVLRNAFEKFFEDTITTRFEETNGFIFEVLTALSDAPRCVHPFLSTQPQRGVEKNKREEIREGERAPEEISAASDSAEQKKQISTKPKKMSSKEKASMGLCFREAVTLDDFLDGYNTQVNLPPKRVLALTKAEKSKRSSYINYWKAFARIFRDALSDFETLFGDKAGEYIGEFELAMEEALVVSTEQTSKRAGEQKTVEASRLSFHFCFGRNARDDANELESERHHESDASEDVYFVTSEERCSEL